MPAPGFKHVPIVTSQHHARAVTKIELAAIQSLRDCKKADRIGVTPLDKEFVESIRKAAQLRGIDEEWLLGFTHGICLAMDEALDDEHKRITMSG